MQVILNPVVTPEIFNLAKVPVNHPWFRVGQPPVMLAVGRLTKQKDFITLIHAFALVRKQCPAKLVIIGEGEERQNLETKVMELGIQDDVDLPGFVENPYAYMAGATLFVLSSIYEGLPTVLIEAMALGLPIVSTDCPSGPSEILENGKYGTLVPIGDKTTMAHGILRTILKAKSQNVTPNIWSSYEVENVTESYLKVLLG